MTVMPEQIAESRRLTPVELAKVVKAMREDRKWTQATLAEIARVDERTVQRVENGEPSSLDTHRALARAFGFKALDIFDTPVPFPNVEKLKAYEEELDKTTVVILITRIKEARTLRMMVEGTLCSSTEELGELSAKAREAFAAVVDYLRDYNDVSDHYSMTQRLDVDRDIDALLQTIRDEGAAVGAGLRHTRVRSKTEAPSLEPMDWTIIYFVLAPDDALPSNVRAPKAMKFE